MVFEKENLEEFLALLEQALENLLSSFTSSLEEPNPYCKFSHPKDAYLEESQLTSVLTSTLLTN